MLVTAAVSLIAGALSVLAPCVLPFLPVIVGGSLRGASRARPWIIAGSLVVSLVLFTVLLKVTSVAAHIDPATWAIVSGSILVALGLTMVFPGVWAWITTRLRFDSASHSLLDKATRRGDGVVQSVVIGAALGPVLTSCSPTYAWVIATVLPADPGEGALLLALYCVGLAAALLAIGLFGRRLLTRISWAAAPNGWFQRGIALLFVVMGTLILTGQDKALEGWVGERVPAVTALEQKILPTPSGSTPGGGPSEQALGYPVPELQGIQEWIDSEPLTLAGLRGKVVLVDFWTYSCVNCVRTQPYLNSWYSTYRDRGLEIIGVHAPEFAFEKDPTNVAAAVREAEIDYPVALDNDFATWRAFGNRYWPAKYVIDQNGKLRYRHFGEGSYEETEHVIRSLLGVDGSGPAPTPTKRETTPTKRETPYAVTAETYLGVERVRGFRGEPALSPGTRRFTPEDSLPEGGWTLGGEWKVDDESVESASDVTLDLRFSGREVNLVMDGPAGARVEVSVDGRTGPGGADVTDGTVRLDGARMYRLVFTEDPVTATTLRLRLPAGVKANAFTFG